MNMQLQSCELGTECRVWFAISCSHNLKVSFLRGGDVANRCRSQNEDPLKMQNLVCLHHEQILIIKSFFHPFALRLQRTFQETHVCACQP